MFSPASKYAWSVSIELGAHALVREQRPELPSHGRIGEVAVREQQPLDGEPLRVRDPATEAESLRGPGGVDDVGVASRPARATPSIDVAPTATHACGVVSGTAAVAPAASRPAEAAETPQDGVERARDAREPGPVARGEDRDPAVERQHHREPDAGADALGARARSTRAGGRCARRAPRAPRRRCPAAPGSDRPPGAARSRPVGSFPSGFRPWRIGDPSQAGRRHRVGGDDAEQLLERAAARLGIAGDDVALGGPVAVGDRERGELVPQQDQAGEAGRRVRARADRPRIAGHAALPHDPADDAVPGEEQDEALVAAGGDRPRRPRIVTIVSRPSEPAASRRVRRRQEVVLRGRGEHRAAGSGNRRSSARAPAPPRSPPRPPSSVPGRASRSSVADEHGGPHRPPRARRAPRRPTAASSSPSGRASRIAAHVVSIASFIASSCRSRHLARWPPRRRIDGPNPLPLQHGGDVAGGVAVMIRDAERGSVLMTFRLMPTSRSTPLHAHLNKQAAAIFARSSMWSSSAACRQRAHPARPRACTEPVAIQPTRRSRRRTGRTAHDNALPPPGGARRRRPTRTSGSGEPSCRFRTACEAVIVFGIACRPAPPCRTGPAGSFRPGGSSVARRPALHRSRSPIARWWGNRGTSSGRCNHPDEHGCRQDVTEPCVFVRQATATPP